ncbi:MAG: rhodanese-like domain-containing protein [Erythrobacter sp.]
MHRLALVLALPALALVAPAQAQVSAEQIDYPGFEALAAEVAAVRAGRLLEAEPFFASARAEGALLLDTRSAAAFAAGHVEGAVNLPFSDFTETSLREVIGEDFDRPIYIYCNNNFSDNAAPVVTKKAPLALNIPTFINLVGYGYGNVWELGEVLTLDDVDWVTAEG